MTFIIRLRVDLSAEVHLNVNLLTIPDSLLVRCNLQVLHDYDCFTLNYNINVTL